MTALLLLLACAQAPPPAFMAEHARAFGVDASHHGPTHPGLKRTSVYLPMRDGVRLAVDLILPDPLAGEEKVPAILSVTPYWRSREGDEPGPLPRFFATHGMAMVVADERGTGASFGLWRHPWTPESIADIGDLVAWIAAQPWSNGRVGAIGDSYVGTTAQLAAAAGRPEVRAVVPRFMETDVYDDVAYPGGIHAKWLIETWTDLVRGLSLGVFPAANSPAPRIRPVDGPDGPALLARAIEEHRTAPHFDMRGAIFRDDRAPASKLSWDDFSVHLHQEAIERSGAAIYGWGSWLDGRTADAVLRRFMTFKNPQRAIIGAWSHGGRLHVSPFARADSEVLGPEAQALEHLRFFAHHLRGGPALELDRREIVYFTLGAERWQRTDRWPPPGFTDERLHFAAGGRLVGAPPANEAGADDYRVDFAATTGQRSRWHTELDGGPVSYGDRAAADRSLLTYTSDPLEEDVEITGHPRARLWVRSADDAAFHVYLESVDTQGRVTHLVEGQIRGRDRKTSLAPYAVFGPYHSHTRGDAAPMPAHETVALDFALYPISVCVPRGNRLRVALAGADASLFERVPPGGEVTITVERNRGRPSAIDLPTIRGVACHVTAAR